jgi:hypothetical protein
VVEMTTSGKMRHMSDGATLGNQGLIPLRSILRSVRKRSSDRLFADFHLNVLRAMPTAQRAA